MDKHESEGTQKLFVMSAPLLDSLQKGKVLVVDELDARLHPKMTREIIFLFNNKATNPNGAQLIFNTQDTTLLDNRLFRRDQIWFVEKDQQGASHLYSLAEFKVRNDKDYERGYIQGRYGAVPYLSHIQTNVSEGCAEKA
ncbi:MAG: ATP-binding protein [Chloroflexota bacterium]